MEYKKTHAHTVQEPEVVLNLWAYADEEGYIMRLAGRAYVLEGDDTAKLAVLRNLAKTDFLSAPWQKVPANFKMNNPNGQEMCGVAHASMLSNQSSHAFLFGPLIEEIAEGLPSQLRSVAGEFRPFKLDLPNEPLTVTTVIMEYEDGRLEPRVSSG